MLVSCLADFDAEDRGGNVPSKHRFTYGLHGAISLKMTTAITTAIRTSYNHNFLKKTCSRINLYVPLKALSSQTELNSRWTSAQSHVTTDGHSVSLSWCQALMWGPWPDFYYCQLEVRCCGLPSLTRGRVCSLQLLLALSSTLILKSESHETHNHIFLSDSRLPQPGEPVPHIYIPRNRVAQLYHQALGSIFAASSGSQPR
jgi:hypothetical protein